MSVTVVRLGNACRVVTADLLKLLHIDVPEPAGVDEATAVPPEATGGLISSSCCCCCVCRWLVGVRRVGGENMMMAICFLCGISTSLAAMVSPPSL